MALELYTKVRTSIRLFLLRRTPACKDLMPLMSQSLEQPLTFRQGLILKLHLLVCIWCVWYLDQIRRMRSILQTSSKDEPEAVTGEAELSDEARERIKRALADLKGS
jgi:hypothetical protein